MAFFLISTLPFSQDSDTFFLSYHICAGAAIHDNIRIPRNFTQTLPFRPTFYKIVRFFTEK